MKKLLMSMLLFVLVAVACSNEPNNNNVAENDANNDQSVSNNNDNEASDSSGNKTGTNSGNVGKEDGDGQGNQASENNESESDEDLSVEEQLKDLSFKIFAAQKDEDYEYLESILTDTGSIDKDANVFHFEGEYEHDMEFIQEPEDNLEYRYVHESDDHTVYVGYGVVDYETESSYTIDFEFVQLDGEWKLQNMDKNA